MSSPYTKDALLYKLFIRIILIRIIFDVYYILIFDSGWININLKRNKVILRWYVSSAFKTGRSFFHNKSRDS